MKTAISLPDEIFAAADALASRLGVSRSELYRTALAAFLERHAEALVTEKLNEVHGALGDPGVDPVLARLQGASLARDEW